MASFDLSIATSVLALLRRDVTASCVADRFGVTETRVLEWQDTFVVAGILALAELQKGGKVYAHLGEGPCDQDQDDDGGGEDPTTPTPPPIIGNGNNDDDGDGPGEDPTTPIPPHFRRSRRKRHLYGTTTPWPGKRKRKKRKKA